ncbi:MAG: S8 family serine peptidase [Phycisphaerae bacterium]|nr:S8 family serine peptidase [Phycisphaerae bacterium]
MKENRHLGWVIRRSMMTFVCLSVMLPGFSYPATPSEPAPALRPGKLRSETVFRLAFSAEQARIRARRWAQKQRIPVYSQLFDGTAMQLMDVLDDRPVYFTTFNHNAALISGASVLQESLDFDLDGTGVTIGIWDQNMPLAAHQEFESSVPRITLWESVDISAHATNVAGTIGAIGLNLEAMGMAPNAQIEAYSWDNDLSEMAAVAASYPNEPYTIYISNHSYGVSTGWSYTNLSGKYGWYWMAEWNNAASIEPAFGQYSLRTAEIDELAWNAPYFLAFFAAGNDRSDNPLQGARVYYSSVVQGRQEWRNKKFDSTCPLGDGDVKNGYDTLHSSAVAKNVVTVGAITEAAGPGIRARDLEDTSVTAYSAFGPTDDGRVKPDLVAQGNGLYTTAAKTVTSYARVSGTSFSCPSASGSALLLVQYYERLFKRQAMRASTLKGLLLHTADDLHLPGPDYQTGWGLINVYEAAQLMRAQSLATDGLYMIEARLDNTGGESHTYSVTLTEPDDVTFTLCWTDPRGPATDRYDYRRPTLVHDLDLRVVKDQTTFMPFMLNPSTPEKGAITGDNVIDNVEQIILHLPEPGAYTIQVRKKKRLTTPVQWYSLISDVPLISEQVITPGDIDGSLNPGDLDIPQR